MRSLKIVPLLFLWSLFKGGIFVGLAHADAVDCVVSSGDESVSDLPNCDDLFPQEMLEGWTSPWRFGIGAGYGKRSNPLINSDNVPIYGVIQLSYFGDRFFFDNGDIGWMLTDSGDLSVNLIAGVGGERSFYSVFNKSPVGFSATSGPDFSPAPNEPAVGEGEPEAPKAPDRDYVIEGGLEVLYQWRQLEWQLQALGDISGKHNNAELWLSVGRPWHKGRWSIAPVVGINWLSGDASNYYYGVKESEAVPGMSAYKSGAAFNSFARVAIRYRLAEHWNVIVSAQYEKLADEISESSAVADDHVSTFFSGLYYEF